MSATAALVAAVEIAAVLLAAIAATVSTAITAVLPVTTILESAGATLPPLSTLPARTTGSAFVAFLSARAAGATLRTFTTLEGEPLASFAGGAFRAIAAILVAVAAVLGWSMTKAIATFRTVFAEVGPTFAACFGLAAALATELGLGLGAGFAPGLRTGSRRRGNGCGSRRSGRYWRLGLRGTLRLGARGLALAFGIGLVIGNVALLGHAAPLLHFHGEFFV